MTRFQTVLLNNPFAENPVLSEHDKREDAQRIVDAKNEWLAKDRAKGRFANPANLRLVWIVREVERPDAPLPGAFGK